ncbi:MAG: hypothetical protein U0559_01155 [Anaerolineae bacterium]
MAKIPDGYYGMKNTDALKALSADPKLMLIDLREAKEITQTIEERGQRSGALAAEELGWLPPRSAHPGVLRCRSSGRHCDRAVADVGLHRCQEHQRQLQRLFPASRSWMAAQLNKGQRREG